jgi:hypothetical protein
VYKMYLGYEASVAINREKLRKNCSSFRFFHA